MMTNAKKLLLITGVAIALSGCGGGSSADNPIIEPIDVSLPPVIESSQITHQVEGDHTRVSISIVATDDKGIVSIQWSQLSGLAVSIEDSTSNAMSFIVPRISNAQGEQVLVFNVVVTDESGASTSGEYEVNLEPNNQLPSIAITAPNEVYSSDEVELNASASDNDGEVVSYAWSQISGDTIDAQGVTTHSIQFEAPQVTQNATYTWRLTVVDDSGDSSTADIAVLVKPNPDLFAVSRTIYTLNNDGYLLEKLSYFGQNLMATLRTQSNGSISYRVLKLNDEGLLVIDSQNALETFGTLVNWKTVDRDQDGIKDVIYTYQSDIGELYPVANFAARHGTLTGGFSEPQYFGYLDDGPSQLQIGRMEDVNSDGYLDLAIRDNWNTPVEFWLGAGGANSSYDLIDYQDMMFFDGHGTERVAEKIFADVDGDSRKEMFGMGDFQHCITVGNCGYLRWSTLNQFDNYEGWQTLDERIFQASGKHVRDIDLDGVSDIVFSGYEEPATVFDPLIEHHLWYKFNGEQGLEVHEMPKLPSHYVDLLNTGVEYFVDVSDAGVMKTYRYDSLVRSPIVDQSFSIAVGNQISSLFFDIDRDGDLDLLSISDEQNSIMLIENNVNLSRGLLKK